MRPSPHDYQCSAIESTREHVCNGRRRVLVVAPTGAGKTTIAAEIIHGAVAKGRRVLFLAHREELIGQASARLDLYDIDHGIIKAKTDRAKPRAQVQVASIQTLVRREMPVADLVIIDEAHRSKAASYLKVLAAYPDATVLGLTATPWRLDGSGLGDLFEAMVVVCQPKYLIERDPAVLVPARVFAPDTPDTSSIRTSKGDFEQAALQALMATQASVGEIVRNWQRLAGARQTVVFASGVAHSLMIRDAFRAVGVMAEHLDGQTHPVERAHIVGQLASGTLQLVTNVEVLTEGWDCPPVSCAVLARPTQSLSLYLQMCGRVLRAAPGKADALLLDHAGNHERHGFATDDREWDLAGKKKKERGAAPVKTCLECYACVPSGCAVCPECGHTFPVAERDENAKRTADRDLVEVQAGEERARFKRTLESRDKWLAEFFVPGRPATMDEKQALYDELARRCLADRRKTGWVAHKFKLVFGVWPVGALRKACPLADDLAAKKEQEQLAAYGLGDIA